MALVHLPPLPQRTTQGSKLTSYQHDKECHDLLRGGINAIIDYLNSGGGGGFGGLPIGTILPWFTQIVPANGFMWVENITYNKNVYTSLFSVYGTMYNTGGEGPNDFRLPPVWERYIRGVNTNGAIGSLFGANSQNITPGGSISINVTNGALTGDLNVTNGALLGALIVNNGNLSGSLNVTNGALTGNILFNLSSDVQVGLGTLASNVNLTNNPLTGNISITNDPVTGSGTASVSGISCVDIPTGEPGGNTAIDCNAPLSINISDIANGLQTNVTGDLGTLATNVVANNNPLTGSLDVTNNPITGTITSNLASNVSVGLGTVASNVSVGLGTVASNVSVTGSFTGNQFTVNLSPLSIGARYIVKYE